MSVPSMVHRSGDNLIVRSVVSGDPLYESASVDVSGVGEDVAEQPTDGDTAGTEYNNNKDLPDCKVRRNYTCSSCDFFTQNPRLFLYHLRDVHKEKVRIYECPSCLYASKHFQKLLRHSKMVHGSSEGVSAAETSRQSRRRPCPGTPDEDKEEQQPQQRRRPTPVEYQDEDGVAADEDRSTGFRCSVCDFASRHQAQLTRHEREEHIKTKFFRCSKCTYVTHIKARFTKHVKYHSMPMIKCDMCDFRTPYKWNLDRHCKNHNGKGVFRCSACNFTADIKQSLTVHEMNHHMPPVGQAAGLGVGRRRNKVGASDTADAEAVAAAAAVAAQDASDGSSTPDNQVVQPVPAVRPLEKSQSKSKSFPAFPTSSGESRLSDIILHSQTNGKVYPTQDKCNQAISDSEMARHQETFHHRLDKPGNKRTPRPVPNLIPIPTSSGFKPTQELSAWGSGGPPFRIESSEPTMSQTDINDICSRSANSSLKDFASLFNSEDVFKSPTVPKVPDLIPTSVFSHVSRIKDAEFKPKNTSFFDRLKEQLELGTGCNLVCAICGHESKCLTEQAKHQKTCGKEVNRVPNVLRVHKISASRCQFCRQRCKSSIDLYNHLQTCLEALKYQNDEIKQEDDVLSMHEHELKIDEDRESFEEDPEREENEMKPHPMENKVFVWNDIIVPMDIEVDHSNYEYTDDRIDETSLDLSVRTQSPALSESNTYSLQETNNNNSNNNNNNNNSKSGSCPLPVHVPNEKVPTHGNDISVAQHKRVFKCPHCTFWASTASRFHVHIVGHLNKKPFECSLCSYKSNWRWDITKHIKLKSVRDQAHETAKVLMTDETGRRNYTKYNKYLTEIPLSSLQSTSETSGGSGTRPRHLERTLTSGKIERQVKLTNNDSNSPHRNSSLKQTSLLKPQDELSMSSQEKKRSSSENKRMLFKCKRCNHRDASRENLLQHVKEHYKQQQQSTSRPDKYFQQFGPGQTDDSTAAGPSSTNVSTYSSPDLSLRGTSPDRDERHCRLKHNGDIRVVSSKNGHEKIEIEEQSEEPDHIDVPQEGTYKCRICPFSSHDQTDLELHLPGHVPQSQNTLKCCFCKYFASLKEDLSEHLKLHGVTDPQEFLTSIITNENDGKKFKCSVCPYVTNSKSQYLYHKQFHKARGGQYTCTQCSYNVTKRHLLHQHLKVHGINIASSKQNGEVIDLDETSSDNLEVPSVTDLTHFDDIPLVWASKNGKFSKMYKCRFCPHVNLRKINIQDHEKMHSVREKSTSMVRLNETEHRCTECNYVCNNAGVLSSHLKVHQGVHHTVHCLVDSTKSDEEQIRELTKALGYSVQVDAEANEAEDMDIEEIDTSSDSTLYFCNECPGRFLKENEFNFHKKFHNSSLPFKCEYCSYTAQNNSYLLSHVKVHTGEYQDRSKVLIKLHNIDPKYPPPPVRQMKQISGEAIWTVVKSFEPLTPAVKKPSRSMQSVPLSGTDLFLQRSEAQQKQVLEHLREIEENSAVQDKPQALSTQGNPEFVYPTCLKNGKMKEKRYKCHKCPSAFEKRDQYKLHLGLHGSKQRYNCELCDYSVKSYANYVQHKKKHKLSDDKRISKLENENNELDETTDKMAEESGPKLSIADQQMVNIMQNRNSNGTSTSTDDKKLFWCSSCPYESSRKDAVENHQRRHASVSGVKSTYACDHCDYSVPQAHFLRDHTKLHFVPNKSPQVDAYMICDNVKLTSKKLEASTNREGEEEEENVIFEGKVSKDVNFLPPLSDEVVEKFNNNKGEKQLINVQTKNIVVKKETSDINYFNLDKSNCQMEVN